MCSRACCSCLTASWRYWGALCAMSGFAVLGNRCNLLRPRACAEQGMESAVMDQEATAQSLAATDKQQCSSSVTGDRTGTSLETSCALDETSAQPAAIFYTAPGSIQSGPANRSPQTHTKKTLILCTSKAHNCSLPVNQSPCHCTVHSHTHKAHPAPPRNCTTLMDQVLVLRCKCRDSCSELW